MLTELINEFREGFQIPSYISDDALKVLASEGIAYMKNLEPYFDFTEAVGRSLLKNKMFYSFNHMDADFAKDYASEILAWQMSRLAGVGDD